MTTTAATKLISVEYEVFGRVQGVFFRKHTQKKATELGLVGWVKNTRKGTVTGEVQGKENKVQEMKRWLENTGSPQSSIDKCVFSDEKTITACHFHSFVIKK